MEQTLQGVAFPHAAAAKAELLHSHDTSLGPCSVCSPHMSRPKRFERPWMGFGDGKDMVKAQDQMMKRKRGEVSTASTVSVVSATGSECTPRSCEKFELDFLRHDGHFERSQKKGPVVTFVKQYFQQKWHEHNEELRRVSTSRRLEYGNVREKTQPISKKRWEYGTTKKTTQPVNKNKTLEYKTTREKSQPASKSKRLEHSTAREDTRPVSTSNRAPVDHVAAGDETGPVNKSNSLEYGTAREETETVSMNKRLEYGAAREETEQVSKSKRLEYGAAREETEPVSRSKRLDHAAAREETDPVTWSKRWDCTTEEEKRVNNSKRLDYATEETGVNNSKRLDYAAAREETEPGSRSKILEYATVSEDTESMRDTRADDPTDEPVSKSKRMENLTAKVSQASDYAQTEDLETENQSDSGAQTNILPCGTDCNQIRTDIFRKVNSLMARAKPEKLHIKPRSKTSIFNERDKYEGRTIATEHQAVQTVSTENKKVQTRYTEPKQVQWAILPKDSLINSPKFSTLVNEIPKPPSETILFRDDSCLLPYNERQLFRDDSILMKVSVEPKRETYAKDSRQFSREVETAGRGMKESHLDSTNLSSAKRTKGQHNLLLYHEAMQIQKEQKDLERAREQRRDFWASYERELKRGRGLHVEDHETERKGKRTAEEESPRFAAEDPAPMKTKLNAFLDEHLSLTSASRASSSPQEESKSSEETATIFQQLLDKVESYETSPKEADLVGLQGLRKIPSLDNLQTLEAMEKQLNPETSQPPGQLSPTELDCMKAAILSHNFYPRLVTSFINQHKASAPPDQVERLERIRQQVIKSWRPSDSPDGDPAQQEKIKKYQDILTKFERELEKPFRDAMDFSWQMEHYLGTIPPSRGRSEIGSSGSNNLKDFDNGQDSSR